jgi:hypothetical protein
MGIRRESLQKHRFDLLKQQREPFHGSIRDEVARCAVLLAFGATPAVRSFRLKKSPHTFRTEHVTAG